MAEPCLGCGTTVNAATQQLTIKGANSKVWDTSYGDSATASGLYCDPNTGNLWTPPPGKFAKIGVPAPSTWNVSSSNGFLADYQVLRDTAGTINSPAVVASSGVSILGNTTTEPLVATIRTGCTLGIYSGNPLNDVRVGIRVTVRKFEAIGGPYTETTFPLALRSFRGMMSNAAHYEREITTVTLLENAALAVFYEAYHLGVVASPITGAGLSGASLFWESPFTNITYTTGRPI